MKIGWQWYEINEVASPVINEGDGEFNGSTLFGLREIRINKDYDKDTKNETLIHEILHAIDRYTGLDLSEEQITGLSNMIFQVLKDNSLIVISNIDLE